MTLNALDRTSHLEVIVHLTSKTHFLSLFERLFGHQEKPKFAPLSSSTTFKARERTLSQDNIQKMFGAKSQCVEPSGSSMQSVHHTILLKNYLDERIEKIVRN